MSLVNQERKKASLELMVDWLHNNMEHIRTRNRQPQPPRTSHRNRSLNPEEKLNQTVGQQRPTTRLPKISPKSNDKLKQELQPLIELFDEMEKLRHDSGLVPMKLG